MSTSLPSPTVHHRPGDDDEEEGYEDGLTNHAARPPKTDIELNESQEYITYRRKVKGIEESTTCCYLWRLLYCIWKRILFPLEPMWQGLCIVTFTALSFFTGIRSGQDDTLALWWSIAVGTTVMVVLLFIWKFTYQSGAFVDPVSRHYVRNEFHGPIIGGYLIPIILLAVAAWALNNITRYCEPHKPCNIHDAFISH